MISTPTCQIYPKFTLRLLDLQHLLGPQDLLHLLHPPDPLVMNGTMKSAAPVPLEYGSTTTKSTTTQGKNPQWSGITELNSAPTCRNRSIIRLLHSVPLEVSKTVSPFMEAKVSWATNSWAPTMCLT